MPRTATIMDADGDTPQSGQRGSSRYGPLGMQGIASLRVDTSWSASLTVRP